MIKLLRRIDDRFYALLTILAGFGFSLPIVGQHKLGPTLLVNDPGAVLVQGWTVLVICLLSLIWLLYDALREIMRVRRVARLRRERTV